MIEFYPEIKWVHVAAVIASGALFALRGLALTFEAAWPTAAPGALSQLHDRHGAADSGADARHDPASVSFRAVMADGEGGTAGGVCSFRGIYAFKYAKTRLARLACWIAALTVFLGIVSVARAHHPLGALLNVMGPP